MLSQELLSLFLDRLGMVSNALQVPQGREPVESAEPRFNDRSAGRLSRSLRAASKLALLKHQRIFPHSIKSPIDRRTQLKRRLIESAGEITVRFAVVYACAANLVSRVDIISRYRIRSGQNWVP